jgi:hypothetical protein
MENLYLSGSTLQISKMLRYGGASVSFVLLCFAFSCGASGICHCKPTAPASKDYRHAAKHVPLPTITPIEITVNTILSWPQPLPPPQDAPRSARELQLFHVAHAFLQRVGTNPTDCDVELEISATAAKTAPRVIVETPIDPEYCPARQMIQSQLAQHGLHFGELPQALPAQVLGLAFEDAKHKRGTPEVATLWELHPAVVTLFP